MRFLLGSLTIMLTCLCSEVAIAAPAADEAADQVETIETYQNPRVRVAVEAGGGFFTLPGTGNFGMNIAAHARIGTQINSLFALVYQGGIGILDVTYDGEQSDEWMGGVIQGSALAMLTLGGFFEIGAGPALDLYIWDGSWGGGPFSEPSFAPGGHARVAFQFPGWEFRRPNFVLGWDARAAAYPMHRDGDFRPVVVGEATAGVEWH
ncbi:MAG: hypothetical protein HOW73_42345 [Polyangiaceae bacterium]|nr:hypothetical protein [Polyangiaceae bacterium]